MAGAQRPPVEGACHCGGVRFRLHGPLRPPIACHCSQCRILSGHYIAATALAPEGLEMVREETLSWYETSPEAVRGFCRRCGAPLFWKPAALPRIGVFMGALKPPTGLKLAGHIFAADKSDYYDVPEATACVFAGAWQGEPPAE